MKTFCGLLVLSFVTIIITQEHPYWSEWAPLSICTAKPCNCHTERKDDVCDRGTVVQIRFCFRGKNDGPCVYEDNVGPLRQTDCINNKTNCPTWSEWTDFAKCYDMDGNYENTQRRRVCMNQHAELTCQTDKTGQDADKVDFLLDGDCLQAPTTTTTTTAATKTTKITTPSKCADNAEYEYGDDEQEDTTKPPECEYEYTGDY